MKKNFRKIPDSILQSLENIRGNNIIVATVLRLTQNDFNSPRFSDINFHIDNGELRFNEEFIPSQIKGTYSRKNVLGYRIKYPDRPKVTKTYYQESDRFLETTQKEHFRYMLQEWLLHIMKFLQRSYQLEQNYFKLSKKMDRHSIQ